MQPYYDQVDEREPERKKSYCCNNWYTTESTLLFCIEKQARDYVEQRFSKPKIVVLGQRYYAAFVQFCEPALPNFVSTKQGILMVLQHPVGLYDLEVYG